MSADPAPEARVRRPHGGRARPARGVRSTTPRRCSRWPWRSSTPAATTPPRWRTSRRRPGSPSRRSTTTSSARRTCCGRRWSGRSTGCSRSSTSGTPPPGRAVDRLRYIVRRQVEVLQAELPYVTLLLRVRGNTDTERWALERRRAFDARRRRPRPRGGRRRADACRRRPGGRRPAALRHRELDRRVVPSGPSDGQAQGAALPEDVVRAVFEGVPATRVSRLHGRAPPCVTMDRTEHSVVGGERDRACEVTVATQHVAARQTNEHSVEEAA